MFLAQGTWIARGKAAAIITAASIGLCPQAASCNGNFPGICKICQDSSWFFVHFARLNQVAKKNKNSQVNIANHFNKVGSAKKNKDLNKNTTTQGLTICKVFGGVVMKHSSY